MRIETKKVKWLLILSIAIALWIWVSLSLKILAFKGTVINNIPEPVTNIKHYSMWGMRASYMFSFDGDEHAFSTIKKHNQMRKLKNGFNDLSKFKTKHISLLVENSNICKLNIKSATFFLFEKTSYNSFDISIFATSNNHGCFFKILS